MAGVKGRSGGARPGAGRPRKIPTVIAAPSAGVPPPPAAAVKRKKSTEPEVLSVESMEPMEFLEKVMLGRIDASPAQVSAAKGLMAYKHKKAEEEGKKAAAAKKASQTASRFGAPVPPGRPALKVA